MKNCLAASVFATLLTLPAISQSSEVTPKCAQLVALFIELGKRSGETVTEAQARAEVLSESPTDAECAAMLALFQAQK